MPNNNYKRLLATEAIRHFNQKSLLTSSHHDKILAYEHAIAFTVSGMMKQDLLQETYLLMQKAIKDGVPFSEFKKQLKPNLIKQGWLAKDDDKKPHDPKAHDPKAHDKYLGRRLKTIYHTNKQTAYAAGRWQRIHRTKELLPYLQYMPSVSVNKRDEHKQFYGLVAKVDDPIWQSIFPPNGFGCFLGDVQIQGDLQSAMVKWYEGVAVEFTTKSGRNLTVTANHPILTARGWVRADGLTISDDVLCYDLPINTVNVDVLSGQIHHNQTEPTAKNLFKAFFNQTFAFTGTTAFKFNSDVANGEIHIDVINDGLVLHISADVLQGVQKFELIRGDDGRFTSYSNTVGSSDIAVIINDFISSQNAGDVATTAIKAFCQSTLAYFGCGVQMNNFSFQLVISGTTDRPSLSTLPFNATNRLFDTLPTDNTGTAHISQDDTVLTQLASNAFTTDFGLFGYLIDTHASIVFADPVINVRQFSFSGHVYDFQSSESIVSANGIIAHNCKCWVKQLTKTHAQKILDEQAKQGIVYDIQSEEIKDPTGKLISVPKGIHPSFNHNHDRLSALIKMAEEKHGAAFGLDAQTALKSFMVRYATQTGFVQTADFGGIVYRKSEKLRLEQELNGSTRPFEGMVADEWQQKFGVELVRFDPNIHKVMSSNEKTGTPKSADYAIIAKDSKPKDWVTIDFLFAFDDTQAKAMAHQILESKNKRHADAWDRVKDTIDEHLLKADIVPMDLRKADARIATKIIAYVLSLPKEKQKQIVFVVE